MCSILYGCVSQSKLFEQGYSLLLKNLCYFVPLVKDELAMYQSLLQTLIEHILKLKMRINEVNGSQGNSFERYLLLAFKLFSCIILYSLCHKKIDLLSCFVRQKKKRILGGKMYQKFDFDFNYFFVITDVFSKMYNVMIRHFCCF